MLGIRHTGGMERVECGDGNSVSVLRLLLLFSTRIGEAVGEEAGCFWE